MTFDSIVQTNKEAVAVVEAGKRYAKNRGEETELVNAFVAGATWQLLQDK